MKLAINRAVYERCGAEVARAAPDLEFVLRERDGSWSADPAEVEIAYSASIEGRLGMGATLAALVPLTRLRWVQLQGAGADDPRYRQLVERGVVLTSGAGTNAIPVAQHVLLMLLQHVKPFAAWQEGQRRREWLRLPSDELTEKTIGIIGLGGIGGEVARLARALRMRVLGLRRTQTPLPDVDELLPPEKLNELCARADFIVLATPLTPETHGLIGPEQFALMKPTAYLINVARGQVVQEAALLDALRSGRIAGAALDVFEVEPLPADHPLWDAPNVVITPHSSTTTPLRAVRGDRLFLDNLRRYRAGEPLVNVIDPAEAGAGAEYSG